jgi:hypothetical protein
MHGQFLSRKSISLDVQKSSSWYLFHQALYHTYCHQDADGYATWTQILEGTKFWVLIRPRGFEDFKTRKELYDAYKCYLDDSPDKNGFYGAESERYLIYATPGDIMQVLFSTFCCLIDFCSVSNLLLVFMRCIPLYPQLSAAVTSTPIIPSI